MNYVPLLSIIVPVYNCEKYIADALNSLCDQDYPEKNYEILITDDGSTDNSGKICDEYAERFPFIHVVHTQNFGPSHARNVGLSMSRGKYIAFCDADDVVSPQLISIITRATELYSDVGMFFFKLVLTGNAPKRNEITYNISGSKLDGRYFTTDEVCNIMAGTSDPEYKQYNTVGFTCNKAVRRDCISDLYFNEDISMCEDNLLWLTLLYSHKDMHIFYLNYCLYYYMYRPGMGLTRSLQGMYDNDGVLKFISAYIQVLKEVTNLTKPAVVNLKVFIYEQSLHYIYDGSDIWIDNRNKINITPEGQRKLRYYIKLCVLDYYLKSKRPLNRKIKSLIKHLLIILHIHR